MYYVVMSGGSNRKEGQREELTKGTGIGDGTMHIIKTRMLATFGDPRCIYFYCNFSCRHIKNISIQQLGQLTKSLSIFLSHLSLQSV